MALLEGTVKEVQLIRGPVATPLALQWALVLFEVTGTYVQGDNATVLDVAGAIESSKRNGKTVTLVDAMFAQAAAKSTDPTGYMGLKTVAVDTDNIDFEITLDSTSTEYTNATALVGCASWFGVLVSYTEA
jgi:hypothetical protein